MKKKTWQVETTRGGVCQIQPAKLLSFNGVLIYVRVKGYIVVYCMHNNDIM